MKKNNTLLGYVAIMFSMLFWGISFVWTKQLLNADFPVCTIVLFRLLIASVIFVTFFKLRGKLERIRRGDVRQFLLLAFFEPFLYFIGEDFGLKYVDASFASVMIALIPIVVSVTMYFCEREPLSWRLLVGTLISIFGIGLMSFNPSNALSFSWKGFSLLLIALFAAGGYSVLLVRLLKNYGPVTVTTYQNLMAMPSRYICRWCVCSTCIVGEASSGESPLFSTWYAWPFFARQGPTCSIRMPPNKSPSPNSRCSPMRSRLSPSSSHPCWDWRFSRHGNSSVLSSW